MSKKSTDENPNFLGEKDAYTVIEFCLRHGLSRAAFYKLEPLGQAPRIMRVGGNRVMISKEAAADWRREREGTPAKQTEAA